MSDNCKRGHQFTQEDIDGFNENSCKSEIGGNKKSLSIYNIVKNEDGSESLGSLVGELDYTKEQYNEYNQLTSTVVHPGISINENTIMPWETEEYSEDNTDYKELAQAVIDSGAIKQKFKMKNGLSYSIYTPANSPKPNWKSINLNKRRYNRK